MGTTITIGIVHDDGIPAVPTLGHRLGEAIEAIRLGIGLPEPWEMPHSVSLERDDTTLVYTITWGEHTEPEPERREPADTDADTPTIRNVVHYADDTRTIQRIRWNDHAITVGEHRHNAGAPTTCVVQGITRGDDDAFRITYVLFGDGPAEHLYGPYVLEVGDFVNDWPTVVARPAEQDYDHWAVETSPGVLDVIRVGQRRHSRRGRSPAPARVATVQHLYSKNGVTLAGYDYTCDDKSTAEFGLEAAVADFAANYPTIIDEEIPK